MDKIRNIGNRRYAYTYYQIDGLDQFMFDALLDITQNPFLPYSIQVYAGNRIEDLFYDYRTGYELT